MKRFDVEKIKKALLDNKKGRCGFCHEFPLVGKRYSIHVVCNCPVNSAFNGSDYRCGSLRDRLKPNYKEIALVELEKCGKEITLPHVQKIIKKLIKEGEE